MAPILLNCAASLASDVIENISDRLAATSSKTATPTSGATFADTLAQVQNSPAVKAAALADQQAALTSTLMSSPEVKTALGSINPSQSAQLEITASGGVSVRSANGSVHAVKVSDNTRAAVTQLYGMRQPGGLPGQPSPSLVLAVDPTSMMSPVWSTLPARG